MKKTAFIIIVIGLVFTIFTAVPLLTKEKVVDVGKIEISRDKSFQLDWSPWIGIGVVALGVVMLISYKK